MMQALDRYLNLLVDEMQRDMLVLHDKWVVYTVVPLCLYVCYAFVKWYVLLMPVTLPMTLWLAGKPVRKPESLYKQN